MVRKNRNAGHDVYRETCANPWKPGCSNYDIQLLIYVGGLTRPICRQCWSEIFKAGHNWG